MAKTPNGEIEHEADERPLTRDEIRALFFAPLDTPTPPVSLEWNGVTFEWRRPSVQQVQNARDDDDADKNFLVRLIIEYSYVPGTDQKLFEDTDYDRVMSMPFGPEWQTAVTTIGKEIGLGVEAKVKN